MNNKVRQISMKPRLLPVFMLAFLPWLTACAKDVAPPQPPINLPFEVQKAGSRVETKLQIVEERGYWFSLLFRYKKGDGLDGARVGKLAGRYDKDKSGRLIEPGVPIVLRLKIYVINSSGDRLVLEQDVSELRMTAMGGDHYTKGIIPPLILKPGSYRISVESLKDVPELIGTPVEFQIGYRKL